MELVLKDALRWTSAVSETAVSYNRTTLPRLLLERAAALRQFVVNRTPPKYRGLIGADDVFQDICITAFRGIAGFRPLGPNAFDRWLMTIATSRLADAKRYAGRQKRGAGHVILRGDRRSRYSGLFARLAARQRTPSGEASSQETVDAVHVAIAGLSDDHRSVIRMRYLEGMSHSAIAEATNRTEAAVNSLIDRALRKLRARLGHASSFLSGSGCS